jgi:hypothetical protein
MPAESIETTLYIYCIENKKVVHCLLKTKWFNFPGDVALCREMWLSPVIQATGRQEQWDGLEVE